MTKHDKSKRQEAIRLVSLGYSRRLLAKTLGIPHQTAEKWIASINAVGDEVFLEMGAKHKSYTYETKLAAVLDVVEGGLTKPEAMRKYGIASHSSLDNWIKIYLSDVPDSLRPKPKGRPKHKPESPQNKTREQLLEEENRKLKAEVAYLKKLRSLEAAKREPGKSVR